MRRSVKILRLQRKLEAELYKRRISERAVLELAARIEEIEDVRERLRLWGDEWQKDDWPHAQGRGQARSVCFL